jgi:hypothetical protein
MIIPTPQMKENHVAIWMHGDHTVVMHPGPVPKQLPMAHLVLGHPFLPIHVPKNPE